MRLVLIPLLAMLSWSAPSLALVSQSEEAHYRIEHEAFGHIGQETLALHCEGDQLVVDRTVDVTVRLLFVTAYHRDARYIETWKDGRLIRFEGRTNDNGENSTFSAWAGADGRVVIEAHGNQTVAPDTVIPTDPWNLQLIDRALLFDRIDGHLMQVNVVDAGDDKLQIDGRSIDARRFIISGKREQELWFGSDGIWLKSKILHDSGAITITRED